MKKQIFTYLLSFALVTVTVAALFYHAETVKLEKELMATKAHESQMEGSIAVQQELMHIDSMLVDGDYREALDEYKTQFKTLSIQDDPAIQLRLLLAENLLKMKPERHNDAYEAEGEETIDSTEVTVASAIEIDRYDSLSFVLEKTKAQLSRTKRQLLKKSYGEYLTFSSSKGSQMYYVGEVKDHKANGHGLALLSTGSRYEGEWMNNMRHGEGTFYWADGESYIGSYVNDKRDGEGTYYWPNGEKYVGQWKNDQRYGKGIFYGKEGKVVADGVWEEDKLVAVADK